MTNVVDEYRQEVIPARGDHKLQFAGSVWGRIRWGTTDQRWGERLKCDP